MTVKKKLIRMYSGARSLIKDPTTFFVDYARGYRLLVEKARWKGNVDSPVSLTIDDLTNAWFDKNQNGVVDIGEDWGAKFYETNSAMDFLTKNLLIPFPDIKVTFFTVTGAINPHTTSTKYTFSAPINDSPSAIDFFRSIHFNQRFEIAFHGYDHGTPGDGTKPFAQEWEHIDSVEQSLDIIKRGCHLYEKVFGEKPKGGKTGAYKMSTLIEESIDEYGFLWWCRHWTNKRLTRKANFMLYEPKFFGKNMVLDIPSTIHGGIWYKRQINNLIKDRQIITVQEHISPSRVDGGIIKPNIVDDMHELRRLFQLLKKKNVWHATVGEIAEYEHAHYFTNIYDAKKNSFMVRYHGLIEHPVITVIIDVFCLRNENRKGHLKITLPNGIVVAGQQYHYDNKQDFFLVDLPVQNGRYDVDWCTSAVPRLSAIVNEDGSIEYSHDSMCGTVSLEIPKSWSSKYHIYHSCRTAIPAKYDENGHILAFCHESKPGESIRRLS